ncbi:MAG: hypothetical protein ACOY9D_03305 [Pseudomonadota bacterium]
MSNKIPLRPTMFVAAMMLSAMASAATAPKAERGDITWSAATGLGYDSNAFQAPSAPYYDYYAGKLLALPPASTPLVTPQRKSGFFVPYEIKAELAKIRDQGSRLLGSAAADGSFYLGGISNANEYNVRLQGGIEYVMAREEKSEDTLYVGGLFGKHHQVYVDHDSGTSKSTTISGTDISGRYNYVNYGVEAKYKNRTGGFAYGFIGQYMLNEYEDPLVVSQQDHSYYRLGADASITVAPATRLELTYDHSARDYSDKHALDAQGTYSTANNPLLGYAYNSFGATLRNQISPGWLLYLDYDHNTRTDSYVGYNDYKLNRYGARLLYAKGALKTRLAFHHWTRDYPNAFAFDVAGQPAKTYSGNDLKLKAELEQTKNSALWAELIYKAQNTTDLRYDYVRNQIMAGMSWAY